MNICRLSFPLDEAFSLSLDSTIDSECKKSNSHCYSWQCDRSDLGSIDSSIFKHSLHQSSLEKSNTLRTDSTKIVSRAEIHNDGNHDDADVVKREQKDSININDDTESGITIIEIKDRQRQSAGPGSSVISYDSIYLSSESDRQTVLGDANDSLDDIDAKIKDFEQIIKELHVIGGNTDTIIDNLYSQVGKGKAEVAAVGANINPDTLSKYTDYISKGTLERLTVLAGRGGSDKAVKSHDRSSNATEFQYSSLPDAGISKLLRDCELIDAKLRDDVSVELLEPYPDYDSLSNEADEGEDDSLNRPSKANGALDGFRSEPISLEENPKGAPSIELVQLPTKNLIANELIKSDNNTTKIYLPDIGLELDYENSIASFESDSDFESPGSFCKSPIFNLVTISGRKVIVDELAAKVEQKDKKVASEVETKRPSERVGKKVNGSDKHKAHSDKEVEIKASEGKQEPVDSGDSKNLGEARVQSGSERPTYRLLRRNCMSFNMPRPQLLSIVDSKNSAPKHKAMAAKVDSDEGPTINQTEREFLHKVDSVRSYWSKMVDDESAVSNLKKNFLSTKSSSDIPESLKNEDFQSFFPTVEIVELNGETQAALVTSRKLNDVEFDHVRYKVMKSDMFQKNLLVGNRKETQFDGLMQYLQDYSFQELLANNNVVIIEPVRTKIEKVSEKPNKAQSATCKITNGAQTSNNLKKHFFYHPIRVNKELYEEELPVPDTVRNVRKLFEGSLRRKDDAKLAEARKTIRYLTIDTSFDNNNNNNNLNVSKWDSISLSSGVSSAADLNSPCECHENSNKDIKFICSSKDNDDGGDKHDDDDDEFKSHFVSADVMEKIRECGSSITYYGGQTVGAKINSDLMTKAIMREISNQKCHCQSRRPSKKLSNDYSGESKAFEGFAGTNLNSSRVVSGLKFKLVKSNSCSSRLELTGTGMEKGNSDAMEEMRRIIHNQSDSSPDEDEKDLDEHEETVKDMVSRLESKASSVPSKPRIIESRCIEKASKELTINQQTFEKVKIAPHDYVTVNNHANSGSQHPQEDGEAKPKVVRNKNVDLAMASVTRRNEQSKNVKASDMENLAHKESSPTMPEPSHVRQAKWSNICRMESVEMVKNQDKINNCAHIKSHPHVEAPPKSAQKSMTGAEEKPIKMVNWSTVGNTLGKEYIANDRSLIQTKIYDEMEFEEFEVMGEHYDSLNSK